MAISVDYITKVITVPQADCTFVSGTFYTLDTEGDFRLQLMALFADEDHIWMKIPYNHNTEVTIAGTVYARTISIINGYSIQFTPDSQWTVQLEGSNNDIWDVGSGILVQNQVQVIPTNSAGLIVGAGAAGATADEVWAHVGTSAVDKEDDLQKARDAAEAGFAVSV